MNFKTNATRILENAKVSHTAHHYESNDGQIDGISVATKMGQPFELVYKTLVTVSPQKVYYVFVIPVDEELDLKATARSVGEKSVEMIKVADINKITGYIRGGCSPIGMKKLYKTVIDSSAQTLENFFVSAGKIGYQLELSPKALAELIGADFCDIIIKKGLLKSPFFIYLIDIITLSQSDSISPKFINGTYIASSSSCRCFAFAIDVVARFISKLYISKSL